MTCSSVKVLSAPKILDMEFGCLDYLRKKIESEREASIDRLMQHRVKGWFIFKRKPNYEEAKELLPWKEIHPDKHTIQLYWLLEDQKELNRIFFDARSVMHDDMRPDEPHLMVDYVDYRLLRKYSMEFEGENT